MNREKIEQTSSPCAIVMSHGNNSQLFSPPYSGPVVNVEVNKDSRITTITCHPWEYPYDYSIEKRKNHPIRKNGYDNMDGDEDEYYIKMLLEIYKIRMVDRVSMYPTVITVEYNSIADIVSMSKEIISIIHKYINKRYHIFDYKEVESFRGYEKRPNHWIMGWVDMMREMKGG